jgi:hypothetical protein
MARRRSALNFGGGAVVFHSPAWTRRGGASLGQGVEPERAPVRRGIVADRRETVRQIGIARSTRLAPVTTGTGHEWVVFSDSVFQDTYA